MDSRSGTHFLRYELGINVPKIKQTHIGLGYFPSPIHKEQLSAYAAVRCVTHQSPFLANATPFGIGTYVLIYLALRTRYAAAEMSASSIIPIATAAPLPAMSPVAGTEPAPAPLPSAESPPLVLPDASVPSEGAGPGSGPGSGDGSGSGPGSGPGPGSGAGAGSGSSH